MTYVCPMHPEVEQKKPGRCSICGMKLVEKGSAAAMDHGHAGQTNLADYSDHSAESSYTPLFIILGLILLACITQSVTNTWMFGNFNLAKFMTSFMAGFFLVFSGFKLLDLKGFAQGYSTYDLIAKKFFGYGYLYPFLELGLGLLFLNNFTPPAVIIFTFILMLISGIGVAIKVMKHEVFQCACLGTFLKVPLTKVTLIEDFGMAAMALVMLFMPMTYLRTDLMRTDDLVGPVPNQMMGTAQTAPGYAMSGQSMPGQTMPVGPALVGPDLDGPMTAVEPTRGTMLMQMDNMTAALQGKKGDEFDKLFLSEMIEHHQGAIEMAQLVLDSSGHTELEKMAQDIISAQTREIQQMKAWQKQWGY